MSSSEEGLFVNEAQRKEKAITTGVEHEVKNGLHYLMVKQTRAGFPEWKKVIYDETGLKAVTGEAYEDCLAYEDPVRTWHRRRYYFSIGDAGLLAPAERAPKHCREGLERTLVGINDYNNEFTMIGIWEDDPELRQKMARYASPMMTTLLKGELPILWA